MASSSAKFLARPAAIADDSEHPVPCVLPVSMRGASKTDDLRLSHQIIMANRAICMTTFH
jgi:hypothetical protein